MIRYDVIGLAETRRRHPFNAVYDTGEELFLGTCDSRGVGSIGVLVNTSLSMNIDSFEQLTTRIGRLRLNMWINTGFDNLRRLRANIKL
uniref:Peptidase A1 domain-containing protein n=1 Tax=Angiostrongylus cantonensis TaxID=6313 RepID=A0A0K0D6D6_ANGCA